METVRGTIHYVHLSATLKLHFHRHRAELRAGEPVVSVIYYGPPLLLSVATVAIALAAALYILLPIQIIACCLDILPIVTRRRPATLACHDMNDYMLTFIV